jgi:hypothetical protein
MAALPPFKILLGVATAPLEVSGLAREYLAFLWTHSRTVQQTEVAVALGVNYRTVRRAHKELVDAGCITFDRPYNIQGRPQSFKSIYTLHPPERWRVREGWAWDGQSWALAPREALRGTEGSGS